MTMNYVGPPHVLGNFNCDAAELAVTLGIVRIIAAGAAVEAVAIEIGGVVDEEIAHAADDRAIGNGGEAKTRAAHGNADAGHDYRTYLRAAVARQDDGDFVPEIDQGFWQRLDDVRQSAGLGKRQTFRCDEEYSQMVLMRLLDDILRYRRRFFAYTQPKHAIAHAIKFACIWVKERS
jgi:hypothetical protein